MNVKLLKNCIKITLPIFFGYITLGTAFGLILVEQNYPWWLAPVMSTFMYAGAAQFISIGLFAAATPLAAILITMALVNIRHIVYGLSLITKFKPCGKWKPYLIFALTDETYSILTTTEVPQNNNPGTFYGTIAILNHFYWILGSLIGALIGNFIPFNMEGADFALTALFAVLTLEQILKTRKPLPVIVGIISALIAILIWKIGLIKSSNNILLISLSIGLAGLFLTKQHLQKQNIVKPLKNKNNVNSNINQNQEEKANEPVNN